MRSGRRSTADEGVDPPILRETLSVVTSMGVPCLEGGDMNRILVPCAIAAAALLLAGCSGAASSSDAASAAPAATSASANTQSQPPPTSAAPTTASPSAASAREFASVTALRDAYVAAGGVCTGWVQDNEVDAAAESGNCDTGVLMTFLSPSSAQEQATTLKQLHEDSGIPGQFAVGGNWILNTDDSAAVATAMGGTVVTTATATASDAPSATDEPAAAAESSVIESGTYLVGSEIAPGVYRVSGYYERDDSQGEIIDNDGVYGENDLTVMIVRKGDDSVEINGQAVPLEGLPTYDPIAEGATSGTYLVGKDIAPGRYRVSSSDGAYGARLDKKLEIIDNDLNDGSIVITVRPSDYAFEFSGTLKKL